MPYHWTWLGLIVACMVEVAHADAWDDFSNNLFTDLAPLLALFGERATMQFMSQALGWEDCIILAMAPLGIITVLVSAVRVGGPAWLKAVVGRARENMSAAEMELMSSTSKEVCELYNGQTIVRCQGSTPVWEFIYLTPVSARTQDPNERPDIRLVTLEEACKKERDLLQKMDGSSSKDESPACQDLPPPAKGRMAKIFHNVFEGLSPSQNIDVTVERDVEPGACSEPQAEANDAIYVIRNTSSDAPNIILNLQNSSNSRKELKAYAMIGLILQLGVLIFFGVITYHPTVKNSFLKDDKRVDDYGLPLAVGGTLVLALGMFLCGTVVESSTHETRYKTNDKYEMWVVWIQQKQTVGDQVFEPFATFPKSPRKVVTMSRRCSASQAQFLQSRVVIGISLGLFGFIIQFIGLRGMNSAATLAQLGAVGIMTAIRAWVRRGLARPPRRAKLTSGFELDALAWALTLLNSSRHKESESAVLTENTREEEKKISRDLVQAGHMEQFMNLALQSKCTWTISTGGNVEHRAFLRHRPSSNSKAQQVLETRRNLSKLAQFKGTNASEAINLATAMENVVNSLLPLGSGDSDTIWTWPLAVVYRDSNSTEGLQCHVQIHLVGKNGSWKILADELESVLSLCLFTACKQEEDQATDGESESKLHDETYDWLREEAMISGFAVRLFGSVDDEETVQLIQDLRWWAPETFDILTEIQESEGTLDIDCNEEVVEPHDYQPFDIPAWGDGKEFDRLFRPDPRLESVVVTNTRVIGHNPRHLQSQCNTTQHRFRNFSALADPEKRQRRRGTLAIGSNDSLGKLYAKDLLFSFLFSVAKTLPEPLRGQITTRGPTTGIRVGNTLAALRTDGMNSMGTELSRLGYGSEQEVWLSIITPLSLVEKLPIPWPLADLRRNRAQKMRQLQNWSGANVEYLQLWKQTQCYASSSRGICEWGISSLVEHLCDADNERTRERFEHRPSNFQLDMVFQGLLRALECSKHQPDFFAHLLRLYERQGRLVKLKAVQDLAGPPPEDGFPGYFNVTWLHLKAMEFVNPHSFRDFEREVWGAVNERDICGCTPLHYAALKGSKDFVSALLEKGADPNLKNLHGFTPLHYASPSGSSSIVQLLRDRGGDITACDLEGATAVHIAAKYGNVQLIKSLVKEGSLVELRDYNGRLPIHWGVVHGQIIVVRHLKSTIDETDTYGWTSLHLATLYHEKDMELIKTVFKLSADPEKADKEGRTALILACQSSTLHAAHELLEAGANVNAMTPRYTTALHCAIDHGQDASLVQALIDRGAKVDIRSIDKGRRSPFHLAAERGSRTIMKILLSALEGLDIEISSKALNSRSSDGQTVLHVAALGKRPEIMELLLAAGADPKFEDMRCSTPLHTVLERDNDKEGVCLKMAKMLVENDCDPHAKDYIGRTPLYLALSRGHEEVAEYLEGLPEAKGDVSTRQEDDVAGDDKGVSEGVQEPS